MRDNCHWGHPTHTHSQKIILDFMRFVAIQNVAVVRSPFLFHCFRFVPIFFHPGGVCTRVKCAPLKQQQRNNNTDNLKCMRFFSLRFSLSAIICCSIFLTQSGKKIFVILNGCACTCIDSLRFCRNNTEKMRYKQ